MRITMVGTGYVGLVSGACFADFGHQVTCVDKNADKIAALQRREIPIFEPDLDRLVETDVPLAGRLTFSTELTEPVDNSEAVFIAVVSVAARRWPCRPQLRLRRGPRNRGRSSRALPL